MLVADWLRNPFLCFDLNVILVQMNKTWEEALEHCRKHYTDLTSLLSENEQLLVQRIMNSKGAQTDHVWTLFQWFLSVGERGHLENQACTGRRLAQAAPPNTSAVGPWPERESIGDPGTVRRGGTSFVTSELVIQCNSIIRITCYVMFVNYFKKVNMNLF
jgi:hypothetical protein